MERLQKVLAQAGIASRRAAEQIIQAGRVRVDGRVVRELGTQVDPRRSRVEVDGQKIVAERLVYLVLHKPRGVVCTLSDPEGRPTIRELLKGAGARVVPVGRLDFHTSGALLCTNDGEFAQGLAHPKRGVPKVYVAKVKGEVNDDALERFRQRVVIDGRPTEPAQVRRLRYEGDKTWLEITLREGRNRQVRRLGEATGFPVMRLARISHAGITSEDLRPGQWRPLSLEELADLKKTYGVPKRVRAPELALKERAKHETKPRTQRGGRQSPFGEPTRSPKHANRSPSFRSERSQSARHQDLNRPWKKSASEEKPETTRRGRPPAAAQNAEAARGVQRGAQAKAKATPRDARASSRRRGTSR